jgi:TPR repeat protein
MVWFAKAAQQNHAKSQYWLGYHYENGQGVAQNYAEAARWYQLAADQGNAQAKSKLEKLKLNL